MLCTSRLIAIAGFLTAVATSTCLLTANAFVVPGRLATPGTQRRTGTPASTNLFMADKVKDHTTADNESSSSSSTPSSGYFFADRTPKSSAVPGTVVDETDSSNGQFDPFQLEKQQTDSSVTTVNLDLETELQTQEDEQQLGIWAARGLLLLVAAIWGTNFASVKYLSNLCFDPPCNHPPSEAAFARFGVAALISLPLLYKQNKDVILAGLECGLFITLGYVSQSLALDTISAGKCAFICSLTVVFVPIVSAVVYRKPVKPMNLVAALVALSGVGVLEGMIDFNSLLGIQPALAEPTAAAATAMASSSIDTAAASAGPLGALANTLGIAKGDIIALGQPIGFGYSFTRIEHYQEKFKGVPNRVLTIAAAQCVAVGFISFLWVLYDYHGTLPEFGYMLEPHRVATVAWTGIVTTVIAIFMEGIALQKATATDASIAFASEPVWASLFGYLLLKEQLGTNSYIGGAIIMLACLVGSVSDLGAETEPETVDVTATSADNSETEDFS